MNLDTGEPLDTLAPTSVEWCRSVGSSAKTIQDVLAGPDANVMKAIQEGIDRANKLAPCNYQRIQKWTVLPRDFSFPGGELGMYTCTTCTLFMPLCIILGHSICFTLRLVNTRKFTCYGN